MLTLDLDPDIQLDYMAEGAANVIYKIRRQPPSPSTDADLAFFDESNDPGLTTPSGSSSADPASSEESDSIGPRTPPPSEIPPLQIDPRLRGKLVRLRKQNGVPVEECHKNFEEAIKPLIPAGNLVDRTLFRPTRRLLEDCNATLQEMGARGERSENRKEYLNEDEEYGLLITDMTCTLDSGYRLVEFKPKWLVQSPSAPQGARRCRTCALRAMRRADVENKNNSAIQSPPDGQFCPLNLVSWDPEKVLEAVGGILDLDPFAEESVDNSDAVALRRRLQDFLYRNPLLERLKNMQLIKDPLPMSETDLSSSDFRAAMTLRDCTLFLKVPFDARIPIEARLADLDLKIASLGKVKYWQQLESRMIDEGWYMGLGQKDLRPSCQLS